MIWWEFMCDENHRWEIAAETTEDFSSGKVYCPIDGSEAVTTHRMPPADRVRVSLVPAARIIDPVTEAVGRDLEYYLEIESTRSSDRLRSANTYSWDKIVQKAGLFSRVSWEDAVSRWERAGLGNTTR